MDVATTTAITEYCGVCLQDEVKVIASKVVNGVPLCKGCDLTYSNEPDVLRDAREFLRDMHSDSRPSDVPGESGPAPPPITHKCICGCGATVSEAGMLLAGHSAKVFAKPAIELPKRGGTGLGNWKHQRVSPATIEAKEAVLHVSDPATILHPPAIRKSDGSLVKLNVNPSDQRKKWARLLDAAQDLDVALPQQFKLPEGGNRNQFRSMLGAVQRTMKWRWSVKTDKPGFVVVTKLGLFENRLDYDSVRRLPEAKQKLLAEEWTKPGATARKVSKAAGVAKRTAVSYRAETVPNCPCGQPAGHKGWCAYRVERSPERQKVIKKLTRKNMDTLETPLLPKSATWRDSYLNPALSLWNSGSSAKRIAEELHIPEWRLNQSEAFQAAKQKRRPGRHGSSVTALMPLERTIKPRPATRTTVDRSLTLREVTTVEPAGAHAVGRKPIVLVPGQKPTSQFLITPQIANLIWKGMTKEQRYDLLDIDAFWEDAYDDDGRCEAMKNILLVYREPTPSAE